MEASSDITSSLIDRDERTPGQWWTGLFVAGAIALVVVVAAGTWAALTLIGYERVPDEGSPAAGFARDMSAHHRQAVEMAELIRATTTDDDVRLLAADIALTQQAQVGQMLGWLDGWGLPPAGGDAPMAWMGMPMNADGSMPGMATPADLNQLRSADGVAPDQLFLRLMIEHHRGGVEMAEAAIQRTDQEQVVRLAQSVVTTQTSEIDVMADLLAALGQPVPTEKSHEAPNH